MGWGPKLNKEKETEHWCFSLSGSRGWAPCGLTSHTSTAMPFLTVGHLTLRAQINISFLVLLLSGIESQQLGV